MEGQSESRWSFCLLARVGRSWTDFSGTKALYVSHFSENRFGAVIRNGERKDILRALHESEIQSFLPFWLQVTLFSLVSSDRYNGA